jgi:glycosyltransferase involved in cell wall biosynthesis
MKNKIKVLFTVPILGSGGVGRVLSNLLSHLNKKKFETFLILCKKEGPYLDTRLRHIPTFHLHSKGEGLFTLLKEIWAMANIIRREKPEVVLSMLTRANLTAILAARLSGVKTLVIISERSNLTMVLKAGSKIRSLLLRLGVKIFYRYADYIVAVSDNVKNDLIKNYGIAADKIKTIYNPVNIEQISLMASDIVDYPKFQGKMPLIIAVGRLAPEKGYFFLLKAFAQVRRILPCKLIILGDGGERGSLERLARDIGVLEDVAFLGFQQNPYKYMARADIFVLSSLYEGFPNVVLEAMACGTPVIATHCPGGIQEIITNGVNGILVPIGDEKALSNAILRVLNDSKLRKRLAQQGRKRVEDFALKKKVKEYEEMLEEIVKISKTAKNAD